MEFPPQTSLAEATGSIHRPWDPGFLCEIFSLRSWWVLVDPSLPHYQYLQICRSHLCIHSPISRPWRKQQRSSSSTLAVSILNSKSCALSLNDTYPDLTLWLVPRGPYHSESSVMVSRRNAPASQPWRSAWQKILTQSTYTYLKRQKKRARESEREEKTKPEQEGDL